MLKLESLMHYDLIKNAAKNREWLKSECKCVKEIIEIYYNRFIFNLY